MLKKFFELQYQLLEKYPALKPLKPAIDAGDNFFYGTAEVTKETPHVRDGADIKRFMIVVLFAVLPCAFAAVYFYGLRALVMILVSYLAGGLAEVTFCIVRKEEVTEGFLITGILFPLILPPTLPLWMLAVGVIFGVIFGKEVFGGTGKNPFNAAIVSRCFLYLCFPIYMASTWYAPLGTGLDTSNFVPKIKGPGALHMYTLPKADATTQATPLTRLQAKRSKAAGKPADSKEYQEYMQYVKQTLPSLMWGNTEGSLGETCGILILLGSFFMIIQRVANWRTTFAMLLSAALFSFILYDGHTLSDRLYITLFSLFSGGMLFGAVFMATDPVTGPITHTGRYIYGFTIGMIAILIRRYSGFPEGVMFAILLMNIFAPLIDEIVMKLRYRNYRGNAQ